MQSRILIAAASALLFLTSFAQASQTTIAEAQKLFDANEYEKAAIVIQELLKTQTEQDALFLYANIKIQQAKYREAIETFNRLDSEHRNTPSALNNLAVAYANIGEYKKAINLLQTALTEDPQFNHIYSNVSVLFGLLATQAYAKALDPDANASANQPPVTSQLKLLSQWGAPSNPPLNTQIEDLTILKKSTSVDKVKISTDIQATLDKWAASWSRQDISSYLSFYSNEFQTPAEVSRKSWEAYRKDRLKEPGFIKVTVENAHILLSDDGQLAVASFMQNYKSDTYKEHSRKQLVLRQYDGQWLIYSEYSE